MFIYTAMKFIEVLLANDVIVFFASADGNAYYGILKFIKEQFPAVYARYQQAGKEGKLRPGMTLRVPNGDKCFVFVISHQWYDKGGKVVELERGMATLHNQFDLGKFNAFAKGDAESKRVNMGIVPTGLLSHCKFTWEQAGKAIAQSGISQFAETSEVLNIAINKKADMPNWPVLAPMDEDEVAADVKEATKEEVEADRQSHSFRLANLPDILTPDILQIEAKHVTAKLANITIPLDNWDVLVDAGVQ